MPASPLRKLIKSRDVQVLSNLFSTLDPSLVVLDLEKRPLLGNSATPLEDSPELTALNHNGEQVGWVASRDNPVCQSSTAAFLEYWLDKETGQRSLAAEVLDNYRELHLFYRFSEKLAASLQQDLIAQLALDEICPLIRSTHGYVALINEENNDRNVIAEYHQQPEQIPWLAQAGDFIQGVIDSGSAELTHLTADGQPIESERLAAISFLCAPLKTDKRLLGLVFLVGEGPRRFTAGDLKLVYAIALQTAPAIEIAFLHQLELEKTILERDLATARRVQAALLPQIMPTLKGWRIAALWQPARMVSGDLYEFLPFNDGKLGIAIADVTDKGVPAALIMANTRSVMRAVVSIMNRGQSIGPGKLLAEANRILHEDIPLGMFVTCLLVVLDPQTGEITYANAGHNLPYLRTTGGVQQLRARGAALGIFPESEYEEFSTRIQPGSTLLMYSDGLTEAHNPAGAMFDYPRLQQLLADQVDGQPLEAETLLKFLMSKLHEFTGPAWVQEDDVTLVAIERLAG